jgi:hypothetical protein
MPTTKITSFWYAIYKRLWAIGARVVGGFTLRPEATRLPEGKR